MQISAVSSYDYSCRANQKQPSFKMLRTDYSAGNLIKKLSAADKLEVKNIRKSLEKTKHWDLYLHAVGRKHKKNFTFRFVNKNNSDNVIRNNFNPYKLENNQIYIYTINSGKNENISTVDILSYETKEIAEELYNKYLELVDKHFKKHWVLSPIENLRDRVLKLQMLEKAYKFDSSQNNKTIINTTAGTKPFISHI